MNAVRQYVRNLPRHVLRRALQGLGSDAEDGGESNAALRNAVVEGFELDLVKFLNHCTRSELDEIAGHVKLDSTGSVGDLRARLWLYGAHGEAGGATELGTPWQPLPIVLGGKLVFQGDLGGAAPPPSDVPRPIPPSVPVPPVPPEPDTIEELLDNATALVGARLGVRGRDKGAYGSAIATLLGVEERGHMEPDWRGEVEIKTVPVVRDPSGWWRLKEDPAVSMEHATPLSKLRRVLWVVRVADEANSPILSWYYQELSEPLRELVARDLHLRPKGAAGATTRGWYLRKRFFTDSGLLRSLNG